MWTIRDRAFRRATPDEITSLQNQDGAPHVMFCCTCGHGSWSAKNLTLTRHGGYNGCRNIFYNGDGPECTCPPTQLVCVVPANQEPSHA